MTIRPLLSSVTSLWPFGHRYHNKHWLCQSGAAWPTGTPGDFPVGHQKFVACGLPRQAIFSPISLVKINKLFVISAPASLILIFTYGAIKAKERFLNHEKIYKDFACFDPRRFNELKQAGIPSSATSKVCELL